MKVKLTAGAELDLLSKTELDQSLKAWQAELMRGPMPVTFGAQGTIAGGNLTIDASNGTGRLGPESGYAWLVSWVAVVGLDITADKTSLYLGNVGPLNIRYPALTGVAGATGYHEFQGGAFLAGGNKLILANTAPIAATVGNISLIGGAWEVPNGLLWKLLT